ncbi:MAG: hypothetical protein EOP48_00505 [Sphingobacteriales bacterium]|nr:MAG: hypothetical protein EOP48_00505 [Sphingobacteriales bacterium]
MGVSGDASSNQSSSIFVRATAKSESSAGRPSEPDFTLDDPSVRSAFSILHNRPKNAVEFFRCADAVAQLASYNISLKRVSEKTFAFRNAVLKTQIVKSPNNVEFRRLRKLIGFHHCEVSMLLKASRWPPKLRELCISTGRAPSELFAICGLRDNASDTIKDKDHKALIQWLKKNESVKITKSNVDDHRTSKKAAISESLKEMNRRIFLLTEERDSLRARCKELEGHSGDDELLSDKLKEYKEKCLNYEAKLASLGMVRPSSFVKLDPVENALVNDIRGFLNRQIIVLGDFIGIQAESSSRGDVLFVIKDALMNAKIMQNKAKQF